MVDLNDPAFVSQLIRGGTFADSGSATQVAQRIFNQPTTTSTPSGTGTVAGDLGDPDFVDSLLGTGVFADPDAARATADRISGVTQDPGGAMADMFPDLPSVADLVATAGVTPATLEGGGSPAATGFPLFRETFDMLMQAEMARQQAIDQQISIAQMFTELERVSPTRAAAMATQLGMPSLEPNLGFANVFSEGAHATFGGRAGTQDLTLPWAMSGQQMSFLNQNPNVARVLHDIAEFTGRPDFFEQSAGGLIPTSGFTSALGF